MDNMFWNLITWAADSTYGSTATYVAKVPGGMLIKDVTQSTAADVSITMTFIPCEEAVANDFMEQWRYVQPVIVAEPESE